MANFVAAEQLGIKRLSGVSQHQFISEIEPAGLPVVFTDAIDKWAALGKWTPEYLTEHFGEVPVAVRGRGSQEGTRQHITMADIARRDDSIPAEQLPYLTNWNLVTESPQLLADCQPYLAYASPDWLCFPSLPHTLHYPKKQVELLYGQAGCGFPVLHFDRGYMNAFVMQIYGEKEFFVFPPSQTKNLHPRPGGEGAVSQVRDILSPDLEACPKYAQARGARLVLEPGDTLFVPGGWWHTTQLLSTSIGVTCNSISASVWSRFVRSFSAKIGAEEAPSLKRRILPHYLRALSPVLRTLYRISPNGFPRLGIGSG